MFQGLGLRALGFRLRAIAARQALETSSASQGWGCTYFVVVVVFRLQESTLRVRVTHIPGIRNQCNNRAEYSY